MIRGIAASYLAFWTWFLGGWSVSHPRWRSDTPRCRMVPWCSRFGFRTLRHSVDTMSNWRKCRSRLRSLLRTEKL